MKVLIACEYSGIVRDAFTALGHDAISCDILPTDAPGKHYRGNVLDILYKDWDLVIAHPPCTRLANSGVRWLTSRKPRTGYVWSDTEQIYINQDPKIWAQLDAGAQFFNVFVQYGKAGHKIAIENPIQHKYAKRLIDTQTQIIQPYQFGHWRNKSNVFMAV